MKKISLILILLGVSTLTFANNPGSTIKEPTDEEKYKLAVEFLEKYDSEFSIVNWKIRVKKDKVVLSKYGSLERIKLFNVYFSEKYQETLKKKEEKDG